MAIPLPVSLRRSTPPNFTFTPDSFLFYFYFDFIFHPQPPPPPKPCPGEFPLVLFYRSLLRLLTCSIFHFLLCPFVRVFSLPLSPSPFSALLISALSTVCLSSFCMFESCLFFGCWLSLLVLYSHWYLFLACMLFSFPFFPAQFPCCLYEYFHLSGLVIPFYLYFGCSFTRLSYSHLLCFFFSSSLLLFSP